MEENFEIQVSPSELSDFLSIKSGGKQIAELVPSILPVVDIRDFVYPAIVGQQHVISTGVTVKSFPLTGGRGVYRIKGNVVTAGLNGLTQGTLVVRFIAVDSAGVAIPPTTVFMNIVSKFAIATTGDFNMPLSYFDFLFDYRTLPAGDSGGQLQLSVQTPASVTSITSSVSFTAQRVF